MKDTERIRPLKRKAIRVDELPESPTGEFLYCWKCGAHYSASRGDYFWDKSGKPMQCSGPGGHPDDWAANHRPINLILVRELRELVNV